MNQILTECFRIGIMQLRYKNSIDDDKGQKRDGEIPEYGRNQKCC